MGRAPGLTLRVHFANRIMQKHLELSRPGLMPSLATLLGHKVVLLIQRQVLTNHQL